MKAFLLVCCLGVCAACGGSSPASPSARANILPTGSLSTQLCTTIASGAAICSYNGLAVNNGSGCAKNVRGSTISLLNGVQYGTSQWSYPPSITVAVRPGERFGYQGFSLIIPPAAWTYDTRISWDDVSCNG